MRLAESFRFFDEKIRKNWKKSKILIFKDLCARTFC